MPHEQQAWLEDIAAATGTKMDAEFSKLTMKEDALGSCKRSFIGERNTVLVDCDGDIEDSVFALTELRDSSDNDWDKEAYQNRITRLTTGISTIYVGGVTEVEQIERKERVDDAVNACKHALSDGVIAGGGSELYRAASHIEKHPKDIDSEVLNLFSTALAGPITTIKENAGSDLLLNALEDEQDSYLNGVSGDVGNAWEDGVIDPVNVVINSLDAAVSVAALILMTDAAIIAPVE
jgi:chaperonin GroEL